MKIEDLLVDDDGKSLLAGEEYASLLEDVREKVEEYVLFREKIGNYNSPLNLFSFYNYLLTQNDLVQIKGLTILVDPDVLFADKHVINEVESKVHRKTRESKKKSVEHFNNLLPPSVYYDLDENNALIEKKVTDGTDDFFVKNSFIGDNLLAALIIHKYLFFHSIESSIQLFRSCAINTSYFVLCSWIDSVEKELRPVLDLLKEDMFKAKSIQIAEQDLHVCNDTSREEWYDEFVSFIFTATRENHSVVCVQYPIPRMDDELKDIVDFLNDYEGFVEACYDFKPEKQDYALNLYRFLDSLSKELKKHSIQEDSMIGFTFRRIRRYVNNLDQIDKKLRVKLENNEITEEEFVKLRKQESTPIADKLLSWCEGRVDLVDEEYPVEVFRKRANLLTLGIRDFINEFPLYMKYLDCVWATPSRSDLQKKALTITYDYDYMMYNGYENQLTCAHLFESLIKTAMVNDIDPYAYLVYLLKEVRAYRGMNEKSRDYSRLLPWNISKDILPRKCFINLPAN